MNINQKIFDKSAKYMLKQNEKSKMNHCTLYAYRGVEGKRCGIGALITNKNYNKKLEGHGVGHKDVRKAIRLSMKINAIPPKTSDLLNDIQLCHDQYRVKHWRRRFETIANMYGLNNDVLELDYEQD